MRFEFRIQEALPDFSQLCCRSVGGLQVRMEMKSYPGVWRSSARFQSVSKGSALSVGNGTDSTPPVLPIPAGAEMRAAQSQLANPQHPDAVLVKEVSNPPQDVRQWRKAAPEPGMKEAAPALPTEPELCNTLWAEWPAPASGNGTGAAGLTLQREHQRRTQEEAAPRRASSFLKHSHSANPKDLCLDCPRCWVSEESDCPLPSLCPGEGSHAATAHTGWSMYDAGREGMVGAQKREHTQPGKARRLPERVEVQLQGGRPRLDEGSFSVPPPHLISALTEFPCVCFPHYGYRVSLIFESLALSIVPGTS
ncbi:uncharacterized protein LOC122677339 isoform X2 [Cervus elaphus]|nr:uncharacterized protein LOC122677339 isoform X2 [Cervus elaphus]XP_043733268.1 uncharacterized protein LOC122677339 isoform X2 [Cervus elaphus]